MAYTVTRRIREIDIHIAPGDTQGRGAWLILREVALLGGYLPARRTAKVAPMVALRSE